MNKREKLKHILSSAGLKATVQRLIILDALSDNYNHPTAENIYKKIKKEYPSISLSTVYNTLEIFRKHGLVRIVNTDSVTVRYDPVTDKHHHLFLEDSSKIEDYYNNELDKLLNKFFSKNKIPNFEINDLQVQIKGKYNKLQTN